MSSEVPGGPIEELTDENFEQTISAADLPFLVDFWLEDCPPCVTLLPALEEVAFEQTGKLRVGKVNIGEHPQIAERFAIKSAPTLMMFCGGQPTKTIFGSRNKRQLNVEFAQFIA
jgi:thioredoxin 1